MNKLRASFLEVFSTLVDFALRPEFEEPLAQASQEYFGTARLPHQGERDAEYLAFLEWFIFDRSSNAGHNPLIEAFLETTGSFSGRDRDDVLHWCESRLSFYQVVDVAPHGILLTDILERTPNEYFVPDAPDASVLKGGELVMVRLLPWHDELHLAGSVNVFPETSQPSLLQFLDEVRDSMSGDDWSRVLRDVLPALSRFQTAVTMQQEALFPGGYPDIITSQTVETLVRHGHSCLERGEWTEALVTFQRALFEEPLHVEARNGVGLVHLGRGDLVAARKAFQSVLETDTDNSHALLHLGTLELFAGTPLLARDYCWQARRAATDVVTRSHACFCLALSYLALDEEVRAIRAFRESSRLIEDDEEAPRINFRIATNLAGIERWELARQYFLKVIRREPEHGDSHLQLADSCFQLGRYREAASFYRQAIRLETGGGKAWHALGKCLLQLSRHAEAELALRRALEHLPGLVEAHANLGQAMMAQDRLEEARDRFEEALEHDPGSVDTLVNISEVNRRLRNYKTSARYLRRALRYAPTHAMARNLLAQVKEEERAACI